MKEEKKLENFFLCRTDSRTHTTCMKIMRGIILNKFRIKILVRIRIRKKLWIRIRKNEFGSTILVSSCISKF
jgi:hypothetical protein